MSRSGWSILGRGRGSEPPAGPPSPEVTAPPEIVEAGREGATAPASLSPVASPSPSPSPRLATDLALARLPRYYTVKDLLVVFAGKDGLLDAYCVGYLPLEAEAALESDTSRLQCWLLARLLRRLP